MSNRKVEVPKNHTEKSKLTPKYKTWQTPTLSQSHLAYTDHPKRGRHR
jgi:hypothetical protein